MRTKLTTYLVAALAILALTSCFPIAPAIPVAKETAPTTVVETGQPVATIAAAVQTEQPVALTSAPPTETPATPQAGATATPAAALEPPPDEVCNGMAQVMMQALPGVEVTQATDPVPFTDPVSGASGTACRATATGTGEQFSSPDAVMKSINSVLTGGGWVEDPMMAAGGPTGMGEGFRSGDIACEAVAMWLPAPSANCPADQPISACNVTPAQQMYTLTLDCAQPAATGSAGIPNPASVYCEQNGGKVVIQTAADGSQSGICTFPNGNQCDEWAMYRGDCPIGGMGATPATATPDAGAGASMANPASQNCAAQGGRLEIEARGDGGQIGVCYFEDNRQCEEWALMRGQCPVGGVKVTGYTTPAGRYCAITGGKYRLSANGGQPDEQGTCMFKNGSMCDANEYYNGTCAPAPGTS